MVPKDGAIPFAGTFFGYGAGGALQADNRSDEWSRSSPWRRASTTSSINPSFGGPILRRQALVQRRLQGQLLRAVRHGRRVDGTPIPITPMQGNYSVITRLTWQATSRDKFRVYLDRQMNGEFYNNASSDESTRGNLGRPGRRLDASSEVVADDDEPDAPRSGLSRYDQPYDIRYKDTVGPFDLPRNEITTGRWSGANEFPWTSWTVNNGLTDR